MQSIFVTQYKNSIGNWVNLPSPIIMEMQIASNLIEIPLVFQTRLFNKAENFQPIENCPIGNRFGKCFEGETPYVLCCMGNSRRGNGIHCMIQTEDTYDVFQMGIPKLVHNVQIVATAKAKTMQFDLNQDFTSKSYYDFGKSTISIIPRLENVRPTNIRFPWLLFSSSNTSLDNWFLINKYQTDFRQFTRTPAEWKAIASCSGQLHDETRTHDNTAHITDQYYPYRSNTLPKFFSENKFGTNFRMISRSNQLILIMDVVPDTILIETILENIE